MDNNIRYLSLEADDKNPVKDHVLACLSPVPANQRVIASAAKCAQMYNAEFSAVFVETSQFHKLTPEERKILKENMRMAESLGADVQTLQGEDAAYLISEYCRLNRVTHLVLGRSYLRSRHYFRVHNLADKLRDRLPDVEVHMVPNPSVRPYRSLRLSHELSFKGVMQDILVCSGILIAAVVIGQLFDQNGFDDANIVSLFILAVVLCCLSSKRTIMCVITALVAIVLFDYMFVAPRGHLYTYNSGYLVTFGVTFATAVVIGILTQNLKTSSYMSAQSSFRTKILFDTNRNLQKNTDAGDVIATTLKQISHMTGRNTAFLKYEPPKNGKAKVKKGRIEVQTVYNLYNTSKLVEKALADEAETALWSIENCRIAGASTEHGKECQFFFIPCFSSTRKDGVVAIELHSEVLDALESSVARAIVSEGSLALENIELSRAVKEAEMKARSDKIRADLLRAISHDLRTPLTIISGSVGNLRESAGHLSDAEKMLIYDEIHENTIWLTNLVENLLTASHFENGSIQIHPQIELISDVIDDVLSRPIHQSSNRTIRVESEDDYLMANMDAQMIARLLHNLITNAMENTKGSVPISIHTYRDGDEAVIEVIDEGEGISDELKPQIFDMFYIGNRRVVDSRKSMGLGLFLCSNIARAHGGSLELRDNKPHGCIFSLRLPMVSLQEDPEQAKDARVEDKSTASNKAASLSGRDGPSGVPSYKEPLKSDPISINSFAGAPKENEVRENPVEFASPFSPAAADGPAGSL